MSPWFLNARFTEFRILGSRRSSPIDPRLDHTMPLFFTVYQTFGHEVCNTCGRPPHSTSFRAAIGQSMCESNVYVTHTHYANVNPQKETIWLYIHVQPSVSAPRRQTWSPQSKLCSARLVIYLINIVLTITELRSAWVFLVSYTATWNLWVTITAAHNGQRMRRSYYSTGYYQAMIISLILEARFTSA